MSDHPIAGVPAPDPDHGPERVVDVQIDALADNDHPFENAGIATAYNLASPANRRSTGPFDRFVDMVSAPPYAPMVDHERATAGPVERTAGGAERQVTVTGPAGRTATYVFGLSRQSGGALDGCWLTDRVLVE